MVPKLHKVVEDLDPFLGITADCKIIDEEKLYPRIVLNAFTISVQVFLTVQNDQFIRKGQTTRLSLKPFLVHT